MRRNSWFWVSSNGCSSLGMARSCRGSSESGLRLRKASRMRFSGAKPLPKPSQSRPRVPNKATSTGAEAASRIERFKASRS